MTTLAHTAPEPRPTDEQPAKAELGAVGLASLTLAGFVIPYNYNAAIVALPTIKTALHASEAGAAWVLAGYGLPLGALLVLGGRLGDHYGRRRLLVLGFALLAVAAAAAGFAPDIETLLCLRAVQGVAAAMALPQILATIQATTTGAGRARAISLFTAGAGAGTAFGQACGGLLIAAVGWSGVFWSTAALATATLAGLAGVTPTQAERRTSMDPVGVLLLAAGLALLLTSMTLAPAMGAPWLLLLVPACGALVLFWRHERAYQGTAILPPAVLAHRPILAGLGAISLYFLSYGGFGYLFALTTQQGLGHSASQSGAELAPFCLAFLVMSLLAARLVLRHGATRVGQIGLAGQGAGLAAFGALLMFGWPHPNLWLMQAVLIWLGVFQGLIYAPLVGAIMSHVPADIAGMTGGIITTSQQVMMVMGVTGFGAALSLATTTVGMREGAGLCFAAAAAVACLATLLAGKARS
ncbi:MAG: MFS transporter [Segniliparus sp.]|uniref:MFS transporter n=1 Tax=Segniliparus sp. TaxID=2804064 RepID=UPI003F2BEDB0